MFNNKAVIVRVDADDNIEVSADFPSVNQANHGLAIHLQSSGSIQISSGYNDHDGRELTALEKWPENPRYWQEVDYSVLPTREIDEEK